MPLKSKDLRPRVQQRGWSRALKTAGCKLTLAAALTWTSGMITSCTGQSEQLGSAAIEDIPISATSEDGGVAESYFINFQDPGGSPTGDVVVNGNTYVKVGWQPWDEELGYGWIGEIPRHRARTGYVYHPAYSETQRSYVYDDWGRQNLFEYGLGPGRYEVTVGVGRPGRIHRGRQTLVVEGIVVVDEILFPSVVTRSVTADVADGRLSLTVGENNAYTFLQFVTIVPVGD